eukprot:7144740-Prymnesium_polylepis.1
MFSQRRTTRASSLPPAAHHHRTVHNPAETGDKHGPLTRSHLPSGVRHIPTEEERSARRVFQHTGGCNGLGRGCRGKVRHAHCAAFPAQARSEIRAKLGGRRGPEGCAPTLKGAVVRHGNQDGQGVHVLVRLEGSTGGVDVDSGLVAIERQTCVVHHRCSRRAQIRRDGVTK